MDNYWRVLPNLRRAEAERDAPTLLDALEEAPF